MKTTLTGKTNPIRLRYIDQDVAFIDVTTGERHTAKGSTQVIEVSVRDLGQYDGGGISDAQAEGRDKVSLAACSAGEYALIRDEPWTEDEQGHVTWWLSQIAE